MALSIVRLKDKKNGEISWASMDGGKIRALGKTRDLGASLREFLLGEGKTKAIDRAFVGEFSCSDVEFLSPVTAPCQIICQGKNYLDHIIETGVQPKNKDFNLLFTKADSCLAPSMGELQCPSRVKLLDYELELGLVIGKDIDRDFNISEKNLHEFVAGVVMANDISARDVQIPERQWFKGKSFRGFCPVGPYFILLEQGEIDLLSDLNLELKVNGKVRQKANTRQLMHKPAETLTEISQIFDMRVGDLLLTGTPGGVAMRVKPKNTWQEILSVFKTEKERFSEFIEEQERSGRYLKPGDVIESSISGDRFHLGYQKILIKY